MQAIERGLKAVSEQSGCHSYWIVREIYTKKNQIYIFITPLIIQILLLKPTSAINYIQMGQLDVDIIIILKEVSVTLCVVEDKHPH